MIPSRIKREFLKLPRDDHRWMKRLSHKQIDELLAGIRPPIRLAPGLRLHQKVCIYLGIAYPSFGFWLDMGLGKTNVALHLLRYWWDTGEMKRGLVLVKTAKAFLTWKKQVDRWAADLPITILDGGSADNLYQMQEAFSGGIAIVPYPGAVWMASGKVKRKKGKGTQLKLIPKLCAEMAEGIDALVLDESTCAGNHDSLTTRFCLKMRKPITYLLAGRPFGRDPKMLWSQFKIIDGGETLGETLGLFYAVFYRERKGKERNRFLNKFTPDWYFNPKMKSKLMDVVQHRSISYAEYECGDVPKWQHIIEEIELPQEAGAYFDRVVQQIIAARGDLQAMDNAFTRMRQLSSGFLGFRNDRDDTKVEIAFEDNPKLDRLFEVIEEMPDDRKAVIFYEFTYSGRQIFERLQREKHGAIWIYGATKNASELQEKFQSDPDCRFAVLNSKVGAYSLDGLQDVANYTLFYESPVSVLDHEQAQKRLRRTGQKRKVFEYDFVMEGTLDRRILEFHQEGDDILAALRRNPEDLVRELRHGGRRRNGARQR